jgi:hypothetical protein
VPSVDRLQHLAKVNELDVVTGIFRLAGVSLDEQRVGVEELDLIPVN